MRYSAFVFTFLVICNGLFGQEEVHMRIIESPGQEEKENSTCFSVDVKNMGSESMTLASQNYRIYYSSENMMLDADQINLNLPLNLYQLRVVQNLSGIDASGTGPLSFEDNLGFVNFSVIFQDGSTGGKQLMQDAGWATIINLCFDITNEEGEKTVVLARDQMTAGYGKAYIELSAYNSSNEIIGPNISNYTDFTSKNLH